jgi:hypothetical protein
VNRFWPLSFGLAAALGAGAAGAAAELTLQERLGHPPGARLLVIHGDDLGMSQAVNRATFEALENGWITSASVMVPCPWFPQVVAWARAHPRADLGLHLTLTSEWTAYRWRPLSSPRAVPSLLDEDGYLPHDRATVAERALPREAEAELRAQVDAARAAGINPSHLDTHMGALVQTAPLLAVYRRLGERYRVPILVERRGERGGWSAQWDPDLRRRAVVDQVLTMWRGVAPQAWLQTHEDMLAPLPAGVYELVVHLGYDEPEMRGATVGYPDWDADWRQDDLDLVRSAAFRDFLRQQGFVLVSWRDLARAWTANRR